MIHQIINKFFYLLGGKIYAKYKGVKFGNNCMIATRYWPTEPYLIEIGDNVQVTSGVRIHTHGGSHIARRLYPKFDVFGKVKIENWVYIGTGAQIMPGVTIGEGSLIAAGSIVCKSIPPNELWGGVPAKRLCSIDEYISKNLPYNVNSKGLSFKQKRELLMNLPDEKFITK